MKRTLGMATIGLCLLVGGTRTASAQGGPQFDYVPRPAVSPYLNLLHNRDEFGIARYQTLVRPFIEQREANNRQRGAISQLQQQFRSASAGNAAVSAGRVRPTGHETRFNNLSHYYRAQSSGRRF